MPPRQTTETDDVIATLQPDTAPTQAPFTFEGVVEDINRERYSSELLAQAGDLVDTQLDKGFARLSETFSDREYPLRDAIQLLKMHASPFHGMHVVPVWGDRGYLERLGIPREIPDSTDILECDGVELLGEDPQLTLETFLANEGTDDDLDNVIARAIKYPNDSGLVSLKLQEGVHLTFPVKKHYVYDTSTGRGGHILEADYRLTRIVMQMRGVDANGNSIDIGMAHVKGAFSRYQSSLSTSSES